MERMPLGALRPTQMTVGMDYVEAKALITARLPGDELERFMTAHAIRIALGPDGEAFIVDHHHWARAWYDLGYLDAPVTLVADFGGTGREQFWQKWSAKAGCIHSTRAASVTALKHCL
jgi:hypothetical protein|nr:ParB/Srx family N-terminal domain-containing protein [Paraburkholderia edwinii]